MISTDGLIGKTPRQIRELICSGQWAGPTSGLAIGYAQANLAILPRELAFDFLLFCQRNPRPCPLLEVLDPGAYEPKRTAPGADLRTDLPKYRIYEHGRLVAEADDVRSHWRDDLVSFLIGCSFTFETGLLQGGIDLRHIQEGKNVAMFITNIETTPAGVFGGPMVVSMRPIKGHQVAKAVQITARYVNAHGAPIHIGDPATIGIKDISQPDYGDAVAVEADEVPLFWACGVTPQAVALQSCPPLMITHAPGHMFITDWADAELASF